MFNMENPLLQNIQADVKQMIVNEGKDFATLVVSDELRRSILNILMTYSDKIPHPASGDKDQANTLTRWQILAYVASIDLTIAKWFESHLDALSILYEVGYDRSALAQGLWAVWAAEGHPLNYQQDKNSQQGKITGSKAWCSGANIVNYGLVTYRDDAGQAQLLVVDMQQNGIEIDNSAWQAVGMQATDTATLHFDKVTAEQVGLADEYLQRVGFWHGAAGVAACWYGATAHIASYLLQSYQQKPNDYKAMYLGQISTALVVTQQYFYHLAALVDKYSEHSHELAVRALRANVEQLARQVLETVGQSLGAAPFCNYAHFARLAADLPVFIRQSHGAFDLQKIGELSNAQASEISKEQSMRPENIWQL